MLRVAVATLMLVAGTWGSLGRVVAEKLATRLVMPTGMIWLLLLVSLLAARRAGRRDLILAAGIPWIALSLLGNGMVAETLGRSLEGPFRQIQPLESDAFDVIVVLGGGTNIGPNRRFQGNTAGDRILLTAEMFHAGLTRRIICSGRRIEELNPNDTNPARQSMMILKSLAVPESAIGLLEGRTTSEEMHLLGQSFGGSNKRIGLITSAWHLQRALVLAKRNNMELDPLPADFLTSPRSRRTTGAMILSCIPQDEAVWKAGKMLKEYMGMLVGR